MCEMSEFTADVLYVDYHDTNGSFSFRCIYVFILFLVFQLTESVVVRTFLTVELNLPVGDEHNPTNAVTLKLK